jgi:hypothetical protein
MRNDLTVDRSVAAPLRDPARAQAARAEACCDSCFEEVWGQVHSDPYTALPLAKVTLASFFAGFRYRLAAAGRRTVSNQSDLLPHFDKLIRPNGVCMAGSWEIERSTPYTGLLAAGARGLIIARASVAFAETRGGHVRSFGMAGKVYPTRAPEERTRSANFFVIDDNGGTSTRHFQDAELTNKPALSLNPSSLAAAPLLIAIAIAQRIADSNTGTRQLYPLASAGLANPASARAPRYLRVRGKPGARIEADDFRDTLRLGIERGPIEFEIAVRDSLHEGFQPIGSMKLDRAIASESCDHRLHFAHPPWKREAAAQG